MNLYADDRRVGELTRHINGRGITCLQAHLLKPTEQEHVAALLDFFNPVEGASVLDLGAGTGAVADIMKQMRPDLRFTLLNRSQAQLDMANNKHFKVCADFHDIPKLPAPVDAVMMTYALGHAQLPKVMSEINRVLPIGGVFFLYDLTATAAPMLKAKLNYEAYSTLRIIKAAHSNDMALSRVVRPQDYYFDHMAWVGPELARAFNEAQPTLVRFVKIK